MRAVLNRVPPVFGQTDFSQVVAHASRSLKENFGHLDDSLRKIGDLYTHQHMRPIPKVVQSHWCPQGLGPYGTYDKAGNVKEWTWNETGSKRYILAGAWNEPRYMFATEDARLPFSRAATFGFRCAKYMIGLIAISESVPAQ